MKWLILDSERSPSLMSFTALEMARALGKDCSICKIYNESGNLHLAKDVSDTIKRFDPTVISWIGPEGWVYKDVMRDIPCKVNFWYDDPILRLGPNPEIQNAIRTSDESYRVYVWDSYWGGMFEKIMGKKTYLTHLASDTSIYFPSKTKLSDDLAMVGCLHSPIKLWNDINNLPGTFIEMAKRSVDVIRSQDEIKSWDQVMSEAEDLLPPGMKRIFAQQCMADSSSLSLLQNIVWLMSKNEARVRLIRECLKIAPVRILSETRQRLHASPEEIWGMVGEYDTKKLIIHDTSNVPYNALGHLYHYGRMQIQAVDPQSVTTGIPYRVFQAGLSKVSLLTDIRSEWDRVINKDSLHVYKSYKEIADLLSMTFLDHHYLEQKAEDAYINCSNLHTWKNRVNEILLDLQLNL